MDLKYFNGRWILHLIDHVSRYSAASYVNSKKPEEIISKIFKIWISIFGSPYKFLSDNGGEFVNSEFLELCEAFNITVKTTGAESPWSNGLCERHNGVLGSMLDKITADGKCNPEMALAWCINAKNSLANVHGFSPYQIALGFNPKLPCVLSDKLPAHEKPISEIVAQNLETISKARKAFIESESCERIKRALKHNVSSANHVKYLTGDSVYYKRNDSKKWKGPGKVIGMDSQQILIKHGGIYVRVHPCRVKMAWVADMQHSSKSPNECTNECLDPPQTSKMLKKDYYFDPTANGECNWSSSDESTSENAVNSVGNNVSLGDVEDASEVTRTNIGMAGVLQSNKNGVMEKTSIEQDDTVCEVSRNSQCLKKDMKVDILGPDEDWRSYSLLSRAGKVGKHGGGKYRNHWNVLGNEGSCVVNFDDVEWRISNNNPTSPAHSDVDDTSFLSCPDIDEVKHDTILLALTSKATDEAKTKELNNWKAEEVYTEVEDQGQQYISVRWVITKKVVNEETVTKARLVARGFQENTENLRTDSPTCMRETLKLMLAMSCTFGYKLNAIDIKAAFLQGKPISRTLYVKPPKEAQAAGKLWLLKKAVYGLSDASRVWYLRVVDELLAMGVEMSKFDKAMFIWRPQGRTEGFLCVHVDDFLWCGSEHFQERIIGGLKNVFKISKENKSAFRYLGLDLTQSNGLLCVDQSAYVETISPIELRGTATAKTSSEHVTPEIHTAYRALVGQLSWACGTTRPDISFDCCVLSTQQTKPSFKNVSDANKSIRDAKSNKYPLKFQKLDIPSIRIAVYSDASFANLPDGSSQGGHIIFLCDNLMNCVPISWASKKVKRVVRSTLAAETLAATDALDSAYLVSKLLAEFLSENKTREIELITDNKSLYEVVNTSNLLMDKRLRVEISSLREMVEKDKVSVKWVNAAEQLADVLTKKGASKKKLIHVLKSGNMNV